MVGGLNSHRKSWECQEANKHSVWHHYGNREEIELTMAREVIKLAFGLVGSLSPVWPRPLFNIQAAFHYPAYMYPALHYIILLFCLTLPVDCPQWGKRGESLNGAEKSGYGEEGAAYEEDVLVHKQGSDFTGYEMHFDYYGERF